MHSNIDDIINTMLKNHESKTGKNLDEWIKIVNRSPATKHKEMINYLKSEYGLPYVYTNLIALFTRKEKKGKPEPGRRLSMRNMQATRTICVQFMEKLLPAL